MKLFASVTIAITLALTLIITPASAATPADVTIESSMTFVDNVGSGTFTASGPAVTDGILCASGTVEDISNPAYGYQSNIIIILRVHKHFYCDDESGSFEMDMNVRLSPTGTTARWVIVSGEGAYEHLLGTGGLTGSGAGEFFVDSYSGKLHID